MRLRSRSIPARRAEITFVASCATVFTAIAFCAAVVILRRLGLG